MKQVEEEKEEDEGIERQRMKMMMTRKTFLDFKKTRIINKTK